MLEDFLFLLTGVIGLVTIALMISSYKSNRLLNIFLLLIFLITSIRFLIHATFNLGIQTYVTPDYGATSILYLTLVPSFYLYYKSLVNKQKSFVIKDVKHFIAIALLYFSISIPGIRNSILFHYGAITHVILISIFISLYFFLTYRLLSVHIWRKKDIPIGFTQYALVKNWTIYLFALNTLGIVAFIFSIFKELSIGSELTGKYMAVLILLFWLFIYFKILVSPEILYGLPVLNKKLLLYSNTPSTTVVGDNRWQLSKPQLKGDQDARLQEKIASNIHSYTEAMDALVQSGHIFREANISSANVARKMGVPTSHIVYLFKYHSEISFSEFRMRSRIKDARQLIDDGYLVVNTLESLAEKTGFSSYNPFFIAFKKVTGYSPKEYYNKNALWV